MPKNNRIYLRLSNAEYDQVKLNAKAKGFSHTSGYLRSLALENDRFLQEKIVQIDQNVKRVLQFFDERAKL